MDINKLERANILAKSLLPKVDALKKKNVAATAIGFTTRIFMA